MWGAIAAIASSVLAKNQADNAEEKNRQTNPYGGGLQGASTQGVGKVEGPTKSDLSVKPQTQQKSGGLLDSLSDGNAKTGEAAGKSANGGKNGFDWKTIVKGLVENAGKSAAGDTVTPIKADNYGAPMVSDERLKNRERLERIFQDDGAIDAFSKIDAFVYNYTDKAQKMYGKEKGVDNRPHFGPIAQDLAKNPVTSGTVHKDENGFLNVDTRQLSLTNTAMISQLARKVQELEERLGGR